jgi:hypothetical protein
MAGKSGQSNRHRKRKPYEIKPVRPGRKSLRGQAEMYDHKKESATFCITPFAKYTLKVSAERLGVSRSELIERYCRRLLINDDPTIVTLIHNFIKQDED